MVIDTLFLCRVPSYRFFSARHSGDRSVNLKNSHFRFSRQARLRRSYRVMNSSPLCLTRIGHPLRVKAGTGVRVVNREPLRHPPRVARILTSHEPSEYSASIMNPPAAASEKLYLSSPSHRGEEPHRVVMALYEHFIDCRRDYRERLVVEVPEIPLERLALLACREICRVFFAVSSVCL